jgi:hypothetical protein
MIFQKNGQADYKYSEGDDEDVAGLSVARKCPGTVKHY